MQYPTELEIEIATRFQLAKWERFLPCPGFQHVEYDDFDKKLLEEVQLLNKIGDRFHSLGGWSSVISKMVGWES